jgi:hypothetical protein
MVPHPPAAVNKGSDVKVLDEFSHRKMDCGVFSSRQRPWPGDNPDGQDI